MTYLKHLNKKNSDKTFTVLNGAMIGLTIEKYKWSKCEGIGLTSK